MRPTLAQWRHGERYLIRQERGLRLLGMRLWNASVLVVRELPAHRFCRTLLPARYRLAYVDHHLILLRHVYAVPPLHLLLRAAHWYRSARWCVERRLIERGFMDAQEGGYYHDARFIDVPADPRDRTRVRLVLLRFERAQARFRELQRRIHEQYRQRVREHEALSARFRVRGSHE
jgi:hypothetical protein